MIFDSSQLLYILPEIFLVVAIIIILISDLFLAKKLTQLSYYLTQLSLTVTLILVITAPDNTVIIFNNSFIFDKFANIFKIIVLLFSILFVSYGRYYLIQQKLAITEYLVLILFAILGMMIMISSYSLLSMYLGLEILSLCLYSLIAISKNKISSIEAALKYFVLGAISSGILLYGMSMLYGVSGSINIIEISNFINTNLSSSDTLIVNFSLVFLIIGIAFKLGAAPFHMWVPDVYQGAPLITTMFISTIPKIAGIAMLYRILIDALGGFSGYWSDFLMFLGIISIIIGTLVALVQTNIKRLFAYSAIANIGFILIAFSLGANNGYSAGIFYTMTYTFTTLVAFAILITLSNDKYEINNIKDLSGLSKTHPIFALMLLFVIFSMASIPPFIGLYAKLFVLKAVINAGYIYLAIIMVIFAVIGAYYYLQIIRAIYFEKPTKKIIIKTPILIRILLLLHSLLILIFGLIPDYFIQLTTTLFS